MGAPVVFLICLLAAVLGFFALALADAAGESPPPAGTSFARLALGFNAAALLIAGYAGHLV